MKVCLQFTGIGVILLLAISLPLIGRAVFAFDQDKLSAQYCFDTWQTENGLPHNTILAMHQSEDGYLWLATEEGLVRFDGLRFTVFDKQNTEQIASNRIQVLSEDRSGNLWIGTSEGIIELSRNRFTAYTTKEGLSDNNIGSIYEDREGSIWIGTSAGLNRFRDGQITAYTTRDGLPGDSVGPIQEDRAGNLWIGTSAGLAAFRDGKFTNYTTENGLVSNNVRLIHEDKGGGLWLGTANGLSRFKDGRFTSFTSSNGLTNDRIWSIHEDGSGQIWVGTDGGLNRFHAGQITSYTTKDGLASESIWSIYEDHLGALWFGTPGGLVRLANGRFSTFTTKDGLSSDIILSICEDREGSLWVGTEVGGLNRLKERIFTTFSVKDGLPDEKTWAVLEDRSGNLWVGSYGSGLSRMKDGEVRTYTTKDGLASNIVRALYEDKAGRIWVGTPNGLAKLEDGKFTNYSVEDGLAQNAVWAINEDSGGTLWIGTLGGLTGLKDGEFTLYTTTDGLTDDSILSICPASDGSLWLGTREGGLNRFKDGKFTGYTTKQGLSDDSVTALYEDGKGTLWVGTRRGGLNRFRDGAFTKYTTGEGLLDDSVLQILDDGRGNLWLSGEKCISRVRVDELNDLADGKIESINAVSYDTADGLESKQSSSGQPAACKARDGRFWFATVKGVAVVDPAAIKSNQYLPPVVIEQILADGQPAPAGAKIELPAGTDKFEFHYAGLSLSAPEKVRFRYKLEGYDKGWVNAGGQRVAYYTNISPGNYKFRVIACNSDGVWNEAGASQMLYLKPRFYQTYWFYALCIAAIGLASWGIYLLRIRRMRAQFSAVLEERSRLAREIHDTLAQGFIGIRMQLEAGTKSLSGSPEAAQRHFDLARSIANFSLAEARQFVWGLRSHALEEGDLATALYDFGNHLKANASINIVLRVLGTPRRLPGSAETDILRIGQEALTNAVKHADPSEIRVELDFEEKTLRLCVADNGRGFDADRAGAMSSDHFGLIGMRERAARIGGQLAITSDPGKGTRVDLEVSC